MVRDIAATLVEYQSGRAALLLRSAETTGGVGDWIYWMMGYARLNGMENVGLHSSLSGIPLDLISWKALFPSVSHHVKTRPSSLEQISRTHPLRRSHHPGVKDCLREKVPNCIETTHKSHWSRTLLKKLGANKCRTATNKIKPPQTK